MYAKLLVLTILLFAIGATLLVQRQQRLHLAHETMLLRREAERTRQVIWSHQAAAAERLTPAEVARLAESLQLALEPATPLWRQTTDAQWRYAEVNDADAGEVGP